MRKIIVLALAIGLALVATSVLALDINFNKQDRGAPTKWVEDVYNASGGQLIVGAVVIWNVAPMDYTTQSDTNRVGVTTTTSTMSNLVAGVVISRTIDTAAYGRIQTYGWCATVNSSEESASMAAGDWVGTCATAGEMGYYSAGIQTVNGDKGYLGNVLEAVGNQDTYKVFIRCR